VLKPIFGFFGAYSVIPAHSFFKFTIILRRMSFTLRLIVFYCLIAVPAKSYIYPAEGITLKHTQIMFQYDPVKGAEVYQIEIAKKEGILGINNIYSSYDSSSAHLVHKLKFNASYKWRYSALAKGKKIFTSKEFLFETTKTELDKVFRPNVSDHDSAKTLPGLIFFDYGLVMDRKGELVLITDSFGVEKRDFCLTQNGTITYVRHTTAYDRSLNGVVIWKSLPIIKDKTVISDYHHDVTKLPNLHYLVMAKADEPENPKFRKQYNEAIVEVDRDNNIHWLWKENDHLNDTAAVHATHLNSIFLDKNKNEIYVSGRDINSVFVINRRTNRVDFAIGYKFSPETEFYPQVIFSGQHHAQLLDNGNILIFNNNTRWGRGGGTNIMEINKPDRSNPYVTSQFIYLYDFGSPEQNFCPKGGGIIKLKNNNYLISSSAYNRNFEINGNGHLVWQCQPEKLDTLAKKWLGMGSYRANFAETLYPSYFSLEEIYKDGKFAGFRITNEGSSADTYEITITEKGKAQVRNNELMSGRHLIIPSDPSKKISVKVIPKSDPTNTKEIKRS
jgi:hypothetical protein